MSLLSIIGTRPQFIKSALLSEELKKQGINEIIVHTGQHYDQNMSDIFFQELNLPKPKYHLKHGGKSHAQMTGELMIELEKIILFEKAAGNVDAVMVYGDCNTTLAGALVAAKLNIRVIHVESGLRSFDHSMPEEINRILTDRISWLFLCPTTTAVKNLANEGRTVYKNPDGDLMIELLRKLMPKIRENRIDTRLNLPKNYFLATIHRQDNTTPIRLRKILRMFAALPHPVVLPIHPRTRKIVDENKLEMTNVVVIDPVGYLDMMSLAYRCQAIITDSGGLQKEAYELRKPCYTIRKNTEWTELLKTQWNKLIYDQFPQDILQDIATIKKKNHPLLYPKQASVKMGNRIKDFLINMLNAQ
jgi:UDP-GlcNAc3NAcA epimerase